MATNFNFTTPYTAPAGNAANFSFNPISALSESASPGDTISVTVTYRVSLAETNTSSDSITGGAIYPVVLSETNSTSDLYSNHAIWPVVLSESNIASDHPGGTATYAVVLGEAGTATDGFGAAGSIYNVVLSEAGSASDLFDATTAAIISQLIQEILLGETTTVVHVDQLTQEVLLTDPTVTARTDVTLLETLIVDAINEMRIDLVVLETLLIPVIAVSLSEGLHLVDHIRLGGTVISVDLLEGTTALDKFTNVEIPSKQSPYQPVPLNMANWSPWCALMARAINGILAGGQNITTRTLTLDANTTTTTITDSRIGATSFIDLLPLTAAAANEKWWITDQKIGEATINHTNSAITSRTYRLIVIA